MITGSCGDSVLRSDFHHEKAGMEYLGKATVPLRVFDFHYRVACQLAALLVEYRRETPGGKHVHYFRHRFMFDPRILRLSVPWITSGRSTRIN